MTFSALPLELTQKVMEHVPQKDKYSAAFACWEFQRAIFGDGGQYWRDFLKERDIQILTDQTPKQRVLQYCQKVIRVFFQLFANIIDNPGTRRASRLEVLKIKNLGMQFSTVMGYFRIMPLFRGAAFALGVKLRDRALLYDMRRLGPIESICYQKAFTLAARNGDLPIVKAMCASEVLTCTDFLIAIEKASLQGQMEVVQFLFQKIKPTNLDEKNAVILTAALVGQTKFLEEFMTKEGFVNPVGYAFLDAVRNEDLDSVRGQLQENRDLLDGFSTLALLWSVWKGNTDLFVLLLDHAASFDATAVAAAIVGRGNLRMFHHFIHRHPLSIWSRHLNFNLLLDNIPHLGIAKELLQNGPPLIDDFFPGTLNTAAYLGFLDILKLLLQHHTFTPLELGHALEMATMGGHLACVQLVLEKGNIDPDFLELSQLAAKVSNHTEILQKLTPS